KIFTLPLPGQNPSPLPQSDICSPPSRAFPLPPHLFHGALTYPSSNPTQCSSKISPVLHHRCSPP
uniref:Uncharacterized protein n=1 Tax=Aegilops tauschii subsp. strangulata TaxID=200361 RepID=A0A453PDH0_AEGTS